MRLEFDSIEELDDFLDWAWRRFAAEAALPDPAEVSSESPDWVKNALPPATPADVDSLVAAAMSGTKASEHEHEHAAGGAWPYGSTPPVATPPAGDDKPKRTRRTRAEIEAAKAAEAGTPAASDGAPPANANPFASTQAAANAAMSEQPASNPTALAAQAHVEQPVAESTAPTPPAVDASDVHAWLVAKAAELGPVGATQHLQAARNFIAKFQMPKYNDSFKLADLPSDVMKYSDVQRAMHCAAMEYLSTHD